MAQSQYESSDAPADLFRTLPSMRGQCWLACFLCQTPDLQAARGTISRANATRRDLRTRTMLSDSRGPSRFAWLRPHAIRPVSETSHFPGRATPPSRYLAARGKPIWECSGFDGVSTLPILGLG